MLAFKRKLNTIQKEAIFIAPSLTLYTIFFVIPFAIGIYYSFTNWQGISHNYEIIGLSNYTSLIKDQFFIDSIKRTLYFTLFNIFFTNVLGMIFALMLAGEVRFNKVYRLILMLPSILSLVVTGFLWQFMFTKISADIYKYTSIDLFNTNWLSDNKVILYSIVIVTVWQGLGYIMMIFIAGIKSVNTSVIEAGKIDGANGMKSFFYLQLPLMLPTILVGIFLNLAGSIKIFDVVFSLTGGGPGRISEVMVLNIYKEAFINNRLGYANAKAIVLTAVVILIVSIQMICMNKVGDQR